MKKSSSKKKLGIVAAVLILLPAVAAILKLAGVLYISEPHKTTSHLCACGCGNVVVCRMVVVTECFGR